MFNLLKRSIGMVAEVLEVGFHVAAEVIDQMGVGVQRSELELRARTWSLRCAELEHQNGELMDMVDHLKFNGPTLYEDERIALRTCMNHTSPLSQSEDSDLWIRQTINGLLNRADCIPTTTSEMADAIEGSIRYTKLHSADLEDCGIPGFDGWLVEKKRPAEAVPAAPALEMPELSAEERKRCEEAETKYKEFVKPVPLFSNTRRCKEDCIGRCPGCTKY